MQEERLDFEITGAAVARLANGAEPYPASLAVKLGESDLRGDLTLALARDPAKRRVLGQIGDPGEQDLVAGEAEDVADPVVLAPRHGLVPTVVAVAAHQDLHSWPAGADGLDDVAQHQGNFGTPGVLPGRRITATGLPLLAS